VEFEKKRPVSKTAQHILKQRYFHEGETTWEQVADRVTDWVMGTSKNKEEFRELIKHSYFVPNSPALVNSGIKGAGLSACFVVDFKDSTEEIIKTKGDFFYIARKGGGCGTSLSKIRPKGDSVGGSAHKYAGGPIAFADTISYDMDAITQAGFRAMAIMFTMSVYHPDIIQFITAKHEEGKIHNANISVVIDDAFMGKVINDEKYWTEFNGVKYHEYNAKDIFDMIVEGAWRNGEPGMLFQDAIDDSPYKYSGQKIMATNPCGEQPLPPNGSCNLGALDLSKFIKKDLHMDWEKLERAVELSVEFLDRVITRSTFPTPEINQWAVDNRPIGLGIMGFADMLLMKEIAYGSDESLNLLGRILERIYAVAEETSVQRGDRLGVPVECQKLPEPRRNITLTTIAPTGTTSLIAGCSSGIEPVFSEITIRNDKTGTYTFVNDLAEKDYFRCAVSSNGSHEVTWEEHIAILEMAQRYIDSGVSKTVNFPTMTHRETIGKAFIRAWRSDCKGLAVYRNGSRKVEVLSPKNIARDKCPLCDTEIIVVANQKKCPSCEWREK